ncbi:MAG: hypothetical protein M3R13_04570 [Armatimonadota bacterium]|nr:hypothetical protein [Armatimonadota bacterium]
MTLFVLAIIAGQIPSSPVPPQMQQVSFLVGQWAGSVQGTSVRFDVEAGPGKRSLRFGLILSGRNVRSFSDDGFLWWDDEPGAFRTLAMSSISNDPRREIGRLVAGALVMVSEPFEVDGRSERSRRTISKSGEGLKFEIASREGEAWKPRVTALLTRRR